MSEPSIARPLSQSVSIMRAVGGGIEHNAKPKPIVWSKTEEDILTQEQRALDALDDSRGNRQ
jgi:hypothetical protein